MSSTCSNKAGAQEWVKFSRQTKYFVDYAKATSTIPAADAAALQIARLPAWPPSRSTGCGGPAASSS
ncbi:hypothetical protein SGLAM104S_08294 [Streptomyces glaucescens]